jgi:hypothetical protein
MSVLLSEINDEFRRELKKYFAQIFIPTVFLLLLFLFQIILCGELATYERILQASNLNSSVLL